MDHQITRHRHDTKRRTLTVKETTRITPNMIRILLAGSDLEGFVSMSPDDHVKLFLPATGGEAERRDYTPRHYDPVAQTLALEFAVHDAGPATRWAIDAKVGSTVEIGGPRGSRVISPTFDWWLLIGDETALPSIARRIEEFAPGTRVTSVVAVENTSEEQTFKTAANLEAIWVHRPSDRADDAAPLLAAVQKLAVPEGDGFIWIAAEAGIARALRDHVINVRKHQPAWMKVAGYWQKGVADADVSMD